MRCCLGMRCTDRCHWRRLMALLFQRKTANTVSERRFGGSRAMEGASWRTEPGAGLMLSAEVGAGTGEPLGRAAGAMLAVGAVCHSCCHPSNCWPPRVDPGSFRVMTSSKTGGKGSWQIWVRWWELGCSAATLAGKVLLVQIKLNNFFFLSLCQPEHKASPCCFPSTVGQVVHVP